MFENHRQTDIVLSLEKSITRIHDLNEKKTKQKKTVATNKKTKKGFKERNSLDLII